MGGAQPLAVTMNGGDRARRRGGSRSASSAGSRPATSTSAPPALDDALARVERYVRDAPSRGPSRSKGNAADVLPELVRRGIVPDVVTDQTSAHDALNGYVPNGLSLAEADSLRRDGSGRVRRAIDGGHGRARPRDARRCKRAAP